ncbi:creatinine amidohydrolase [Longimycelium tulufanense]|uniref:Creatinine amidohydrolase n=1 Tax=Longimycelium tulufanense TaxID=907463 RepID=A0A8J3FU24_9PSEU|nr:creatininase family protein [Longimycelium tulufanense]GGM46655.1 creatinine amidohydrolase [Longimycelium tulufanense]
MTETYFAQLRSPQVGELLRGRRKPVLLLPVGVVEPHGPHAPLATDQIISEGMCARAVRRLANDPDLRALILPPLPYGVTRYSTAFPGFIHVGEETLHNLVTQVCNSLLSQGFRLLVIVNNHFEPEHVQTLRRAMTTLRDGHGVEVGYLDLVRRRYVERLPEEFRSGSCHAGRYETSLVLAESPELVDQERMRRLPPLPVNIPSGVATGRTDFLALGMTEAYCGAPAEATSEEGERVFAVLTDMLVELIRDLAAGRHS